MPSEYFSQAYFVSFIMFLFFISLTYPLSSQSAEVTIPIIEEVIVHGSAIGRQKIELNELDSANHIDKEALRRRQSNNVFEALDTIPGLAIEGGIRTRGKSLSIRGFSDNEDVLLLIDGIPQNFEKYRSGSGIEIEPELLKELAVFRGGAALNNGAGYIGGVVQAETKDASDFLSDDRIFGANVKLGWNTNNDGQRYLLTAYGKTSDKLDAIISIAKRDSNNFHLPDDSAVENSDEGKLSSIAKLEYHIDNFDIGISFREGSDTVREPFDPQSGSTALFGTVRRETKERASTLRFNWKSADNFYQLKGDIGEINKTQSDTGGNLSNKCPGAGLIPAQPDYANKACGRDQFNFDIWSANISNVFSFTTSSENFLAPIIDHSFSFGVQYVNEQREALRAFRNDNGTIDSISILDDFLEPTIENNNQPSGEKITIGAYLEYSLQWKPWRLTLGRRHDALKIVPSNLETLRLSELRGIGSESRFSKITPSFDLSYTRDFGSFFYRYRENYRPPLADELYSRDRLDKDGNVEIAGFLNLCKNFSSVFSSPPNEAPSITDPDYQPLNPTNIAAFQAATDAYNTSILDFLQSPAGSNEAFLRNNAFCGELYEPEESSTMEVGVLFNIGNLLSFDSTQAKLKVTYFDIHTRNLLESIEEVNGEIVQPGEEYRFGTEVELTLDTNNWFAEINYSNLHGYELGLDKERESLSRFALNNPPAESLNLTAGLRFFDSDLQIGTRINIKKSRQINDQVVIGLARDRTMLRHLPSYGVASFYAQWFASDTYTLNITVDNVFNKKYALRGFQGGKGETAAGRDYRVSMSFHF